MSRSPRKNLRRAHEALAGLFSVLERYPEARADLVAAIGDSALDTIGEAYRAIAFPVEQLESGANALLRDS